MKTYRGSPAAARNYVEADRGRADDYYLAEGTGIAERYVASPGAGVQRATPLSGEGYEAWVAGVDPETGAAKGRLRHDDQAVRFVEVTVNGPKSWSLAAELHPEISAAYDAAQDRAATQIIGWLGQHATTRVGARGQQVQVPVEQIEAAVVRHYTSRAGDPHRHLHLQVNARVFAAGSWRGLHTVGVRDSLDAINGIGHAAVATDPGFREALAAHGFTLDEGGEIVQLAPFAGAFSARAAQITRRIEGYEADWVAAHPGQTPGPVLRRSWDARAWADGRPDKIHPAPGADLNGRWRAELIALGYSDPTLAVPLERVSVGSLDRDQAVEEVLARIASKRSGWNALDVRGEVEQLIARRGIVTDERVRSELAEDLTARTVESCVPLLERVGVPEHIRALTSPHVLEVETDLVSRLAARGSAPVAPAEQPAPITPAATVPGGRQLDETQTVAAQVLAGNAQLVVIEGAAGAGKTSTLSAAHGLLAARDRRMMVVTPTLKAAKVAQAELGSRAGSAAWLAFQHGYRWDADGAWTRLQLGQADPVTGRIYRGPATAAVLRAGDLLLVDEAGMLDQDTARALLTVADEHHVRLALMGDRHQLSAVGRGGVLAFAARSVDPDAHLTLATVHRFTREITTSNGQLEVVPDAEYADLSLAMRTGEQPADVFAVLLERGQIHIYNTDAQRLTALAELAATDIGAGGRALVVADTRDQVAELNTAIRDRLVIAGLVEDTHATTTAVGQRIGVGDRIVTRSNDTTLDVANRDTWTVTGVNADGTITVTAGATGHPGGHPGHHDGGGNPGAGNPGVRVLPADYVAAHVELGYACTVHGVQGDTAEAGHLVFGENTGASSAYVGMARGRTDNIAHVVAADLDEAREQWVATFARDRADLGPAHAAHLAEIEAANYAEPRPLDDVLAELREAWTREQQSLDRLANVEPRVDALSRIVAVHARRDAELPPLRDASQRAQQTLEHATARAETASAAVARDAGRLGGALLTDWDSRRDAATQAAQIVAAGPGRFRQHRAAVTDARDQLAGWAATWRPYLPSMPTDPDALVRYAARADYRPALETAFEHWAQQRSAQLHPEHAAAATAVHDARRHLQDTAAALRDAEHHYSQQLWRHGRIGHTPDPQAKLAEAQDTLTSTSDQLDHIRRDIAVLTRDPALISQPARRVAAEREMWQRERNLAQRAATARHQMQTKREREALSHAHDQPQPRQPDRGPSLGR